MLAEVCEKIQLLNSEEKHEVLRVLLEDIDGPADKDADEAWRDEVVRRVKAIRNGEAAIRALQDWQE
ncbi:addiction module protein [Massilia sp. Leaf139]|uniref:addiction module protein n=1 Tax=Massilia sp. Leaf139 TaxID=1736272 RepID=UPI001E443225|nr:addiction module protein [Massilia sp. Leaf139]